MQLHEVEELIKQVQALQAQEEDEAAPYAHKYEAADLLKQQAEKLQAQLQQQGAAGSAGDGSAEGSAGQQGQGEEGKAAQQGNGNDDQSELQFKLAVLQVRRGIILLETDLLPDGEASINEGLPSLQAAVDAVQEPGERVVKGTGVTGRPRLCAGPFDHRQGASWGLTPR